VLPLPLPPLPRPNGGTGDAIAANGSRADLAVGETEARLIREPHHRFGVENVTASDLEWYVRADRDKECPREPAESA
jgi:hypothetical protein